MLDDVLKFYNIDPSADKKEIQRKLESRMVTIIDQVKMLKQEAEKLKTALSEIRGSG